MLDKQESNMLFSGQRANFSSHGPGTPHFQKTDIATSSYFIDMDIVEEISKKRKYMSLDDTDIPGYSPVSNQYYENDNCTMRQEAEFDHINKVLLSNLRPAYIQQKEPSLFHETYKEEFANLRDVDRIGLVKQLEQSGYQSEYNCDLVSTFLHDEDEQQFDTIIPHFPVVLETSNSEKASLGMENLLNNAFISNEKQDTLTSRHKNQSVESNLFVNASSKSERLTVIGDDISANMDELNKPINSRLSPVISEKIWDGSLKLNTSTTVSAVAFFKSGEKVQDLNWPDHIEIKGKVRLQAFEKFIQELPRSRTRALMVISLCWKLGSCERDLSGMMEVAKNYRESEKVGFAQIPPGVDLYVCPRSDTIITILAKYGFFKGMAAVEEDQDSLIGCVVWRRSPSSSSTNLAPKTIVAEGKKALIPEQPPKSSAQSAQGMSFPAMEAEVKESSVPYSCPLVPTQQNSGENVTPAAAGITPVPENSGEDAPQRMAPVAAQSLGMMFGSLPVPRPRPLIPVNSSNFQFQAPAARNTHPGFLCDGSDSSGALPGPPPLPAELRRPDLPGPPPLPTELRRTDVPGPPPFPIELRQSALPGPPPLPIEILQSFIHSKKKSGGSIDDDDDDLPEFDFKSACEEEPDAPMMRFPGCAQQTHFHDSAPPLNKAFSHVFQHTTKPPPLPEKTLTPGEHGISEKTTSMKRKNLWDDGDDMPEWCPPDLDTPELRPPSVPEHARPLPGRPPPPPPPPPSLSFRLPQIRGSPQASRHGLLGPRPPSDAHEGGFVRTDRPPPPESRRTDSVPPPHAGKFKYNRRPPRYAAEHRRRRR